jgi:tellurite resistance-related uncharacterized protein
MQDGLPAGVVAYRRTAIFDETTLPAALRRHHRTKPGVWALIHVMEGRLLFRTLDPPGEMLLQPGVTGLIRPQQLHEVEPLGAVRFYIEFHAAPETA